MASSPTDLEAVGLALAGFTFWVLADASMKLAGASNLPAYEILAFLGICIGATLLLRGLLRREIKACWPQNYKRQMMRSSLDLVNNICLVIALRHLPLTLFYILVFLSPMVITLLAAIFLGERLEWQKGAAIVAGFAGVVVAVHPFGNAQQGDWIGFAACMVCVGCFSVNMVWSRVLTQTETPESLVFFSAVLMALLGGGAMLFHAEPVNLRLAAILIAMGMFCALGSMCFFVALKHTSAANVSQYHYTQLITGAIITYALWRERPTFSMLAGAAIIVAAGVYIAIRSSRQGSPGRGSPLEFGIPEK